MTAVAPDGAKTETVCAFCDAQIVKTRYEGMVVTEHWDAVQRQPGVLFTMNCPSRPRPGVSGGLGRHVPR